MEKFILDANLFFNMEAEFDLGKKTNQVVEAITAYGRKLKGRAEFFIPPSAINEFLSFFEDKNQPIIKGLLSTITSRSPNMSKFSFPAVMFYQLVEDIRKRSYRGLTIGEEEIVRAGQLMTGSEKMDKKQFEMKVGPVIKNFRDRYRQATRSGFIDSTTDLDLIVLAKEVDGFLVSADEGVVFWGRVFGVKEVMPSAFRSRLESLVDLQG